MDQQIVRKVMRNTIKRVQTLFDRKKAGNTGDGNSGSHVLQYDCGSQRIEKGREAWEIHHGEDSCPKPLKVLSTNEENNLSFKKENQQSGPHVRVKQNKLPGITDSKESYYDDSRAQIVPNVNENGPSGTADTESSDDEGAYGPVPVIQDESESALVPAVSGGQVVNKNVCPGEVHRTCGDLERICLNYPLDVQEKIVCIKENLLLHYPPYYDFCVIASEEDYEEANRFKSYVASSFGLAGCTLDDGFTSLGRDLFDSFESMMDHSSKVFFFVTENFTSSAFCKRLQSGAVFQSLMSKAKKDREKCVPIFPYGFQNGCRLPLALSGIAGLNPTQHETTCRSLINTYSPQLRKRRYLLDLENFRKRCLEFEVQVTKCIEDYKTKQIHNELSVMSVTENDSFIDQENWHPRGDQTPVIQLPENEGPIIQSLFNRINSIESSSERTVTIEKGNENLEEVKISGKDFSNLQNKKLNQNPKTDKLGSKEHSGFTNDDDDDKYDDKDDLWKNLPVPDEIREIVNNNVSSVSITDSATVHVGHVINVTINPASPTIFSNLKQNIKSQTTNFCEKERSEHFSDGSDG